MNYYNENDKKAAQWLRNLIIGGMIPPGDVDERSIEDVRADDLRGYTQCHFFAGIGGWSEALRLAGWSTDRPVWTGSCPCQSFSVAGKGKGFDDKRHLWPMWRELIKECKPPVVFGEQVEAAVRYGWLDLVQDDLEREDYAFAKIVLPACSLGAPHIRQRLWFMAHANSCSSWGNDRAISCEKVTGERGELQSSDRLGNGSNAVIVANSIDTGLQRGLCGWESAQREVEHRYIGCDSTTGRLADSNININRKQVAPIIGEAQGVEKSSGPADSATRISRGAGADSEVHGGVRLLHGYWATTGYWRGADWVCCTDGKARPIEPGAFPLADGVQGRVVQIRGYGNAIVPEVAAEIIKIGMEWES